MPSSAFDSCAPFDSFDQPRPAAAAPLAGVVAQQGVDDVSVLSADAQTDRQPSAGAVMRYTAEDGDLLGEVELTTTLIIAASESEDHLSQEEIDRLLGVAPRRPQD